IFQSLDRRNARHDQPPHLRPRAVTAPFKKNLVELTEQSVRQSRIREVFCFGRCRCIWDARPSCARYHLRLALIPVRTHSVILTQRTRAVHIWWSFRPSVIAGSAISMTHSCTHPGMSHRSLHCCKRSVHGIEPGDFFLERRASVSRDALLTKFLMLKDGWKRRMPASKVTALHDHKMDNRRFQVCGE